jgi:hypothetical protein
MSMQIDKDPTEFFSVVGAPYVPEHRGDGRRHLEAWQVERSTDINQPETAGAVLWLVFYGVIIGAGLLSKAGATKLVAMASVVLN